MVRALNLKGGQGPIPGFPGYCEWNSVLHRCPGICSVLGKERLEAFLTDPPHNLARTPGLSFNPKAQPKSWAQLLACLQMRCVRLLPSVVCGLCMRSTKWGVWVRVWGLQDLQLISGDKRGPCLWLVDIK